MTRLVVEKITPERARELLARNTDNRRLRKGTVSSYARDMSSGNWRLTGAPIVLNGERLLDGQHRLQACVNAQSEFETAVLYDADENIHFAIDKGMKRTIADELSWRGETDVNNLGATLNTIWRYEKGAITNPQLYPTTMELIELLNADHDRIRDSVRVGLRAKRGAMVPAPTFAAAHYLLRVRHGEDLAETFADRVTTGTELVDGDPALTLRRYAANVAGTRNIRPRGEEWLAVIIKAANYWLLGRPLKNLRWRRVGPNSEAFPLLIGADEVE